MTDSDHDMTQNEPKPETSSGTDSGAPSGNVNADASPEDGNKKGISDEEALKLKAMMTTSGGNAPEQKKKSVATMAIQFVTVLLVINGIAGLLLAITYSLTKTQIHEQEKKELEHGLKIAFPAPAGDSKDVTYDEEETGRLWTVKENTGGHARLIGYIAKGTAYGYSSDINVLVGVKKNAQGDWVIEGLQVQTTAETPGLGENVHKRKPVNSWVGKIMMKKDKPLERPWFQAQFTGKPLSMLLNKTPKQMRDDPTAGIDAMSGATITSFAVINAAKKAAVAINKAIQTPTAQ